MAPFSLKIAQNLGCAAFACAFYLDLFLRYNSADNSATFLRDIGYAEHK
jgi:hypothetical protein